MRAQNINSMYIGERRAQLCPKNQSTHSVGLLGGTPHSHKEANANIMSAKISNLLRPLFFSD